MMIDIHFITSIVNHHGCIKYHLQVNELAVVDLSTIISN